MRTFREWAENWEPEGFDEEAFRRRHQYAELHLDLSNLPPGVEVHDSYGPRVPYPYYVEVAFERWNDPHRYYTTLVIPYGEGRPVADLKQARQIALDILKKNENRYTRASAFRKSRFVGKGFFGDESDRVYYSPR